MLDIYLVGCGGIGSNLMSSLSPFVHGDAKFRRNLANIYLIDGDVVENKNLQRTPFDQFHVGLPKVTALYKMYQRRLPIVPANFFINKANIKETFAPSLSKDRDLCVIAATDHLFERALLLDFVRTDVPNDNVLWVTAGNSLNKGSAFAWVKYKGINNPTSYPDLFDLYPQYQEQLSFTGRNQDGSLGCGMNFNSANEAGQTLMINSMSQLAILHILTEFYTNNRFVGFLEYSCENGEVLFRNVPNTEPLDITRFGEEI